jgi:hypothetical protein
MGLVQPGKVLIILAGWCLLPGPLGAAANPPSTATGSPSDGQAAPAPEALHFRWGGQLKLRGSVSWPGQHTLEQPEGSGVLDDGTLTGRVTTKLLFQQWLEVEAHYEAGLVGGKTWQVARQWDSTYPGLFDRYVLPDIPPRDRRRLLNLTGWLTQGSGGLLYQRLDRLALTLHPSWGLVRVGRQAVTWGNGLIFNPMDLCNPFSPLDIERDYKVGDDMIFSQLSLPAGDVQALYVARRDPATGQARRDRSSTGAKLHLSLGGKEWDLMAATHYSDRIIGLGGSVTAGQAVWRVDGTWTFLGDHADARGYLSLVANADYSWTRGGRSWYGALELFYNGLGQSDYRTVISRREVQDRLARGELFTIGRTYLSGQIRVGLHPLCSLALTAIHNVEDASGILIPRLVWDLTQELRLTLGGSLLFGGAGTEFGGFGVEGTGLSHRLPDRVFAWLGYYF